MIKLEEYVLSTAKSGSPIALPKVNPIAFGIVPMTCDRPRVGCDRL